MELVCLSQKLNQIWTQQVNYPHVDYRFDKNVNFKISYFEAVPFLETQSPKSFDSMVAKYACAVLANLTYRCQSPSMV